MFPGTKCEYDSTRAFERAGAEVQTVVFKNMTEANISDTVEAFEKGNKGCPDHHVVYVKINLITTGPESLLANGGIRRDAL